MKNFKEYLKEYFEHDRLGAAMNRAKEIKSKRDIEELTGYNIDKNEDFLKLFDNIENLPPKTQQHVWGMYKEYMNSKKKDNFVFTGKKKKGKKS